MSGNKAPEYNKHFSVIVFTYDALKKFSKFKQTYHEKFESIELLRALENNMNLGTFALKGDSFSVDIKDDYTKAIRYLKKDNIIQTLPLNKLNESAIRKLLKQKKLKQSKTIVDGNGIKRIYKDLIKAI